MAINMLLRGNNFNRACWGRGSLKTGVIVTRVAQCLRRHGIVKLTGGCWHHELVPLLVVSWRGIVCKGLPHEGRGVIDLATAHQLFFPFLQVLNRDKVSITQAARERIVVCRLSWRRKLTRQWLL